MGCVNMGPSPDTALIGACFQLIANHGETCLLYEGAGAPPDPENDPLTKARLEALGRERAEIERRIRGLLPPVTQMGAVAVAKAAVATMIPTPDGPDPTDFGEHLGMVAARWMAEADGRGARPARAAAVPVAAE